MAATPSADVGAAHVAAAIEEPARARMLYCLLDGRARTSTELAIVGEVSPSTASVHLARLTQSRLLSVLSQGRHRYFSLAGASVARALEALTVVAGSSRARFIANTPSHLRSARTCYDHMAGRVAVLLRERLETLGWLATNIPDHTYQATPCGAAGLAAIGIDVEAAGALPRRFAYACLDWSERSPHIGGALGHAVLQASLKHNWFVQALDSRALTLTRQGRRQLNSLFGLKVEA